MAWNIDGIVVLAGLAAVATQAVGCGGADRSAPVLAGVGRADISPHFEPYQDLNDNLRWDEGEPFDDLDQDGQLDSLWLGGFGPRQPTGLHDPLEARSLALSLRGELFVLCAVDALGLSLGRIEAIEKAARERVDPALGLAPGRIIVASIHTHAAPDTIGVFGPASLVPGWDDAYLDRVVQGAADSVAQAVAALEPAELLVTHAEAGDGFVRDINAPEISDPQVAILQTRRPGGEVLATVTSIANHPECNWSDNLLVSADYPAALRAALEERYGGLAIAFSGALGLMQTPAEMPEQGFAKAERLGRMYAERVAQALAQAAPLGPEQLQPRFARRGIRVGLQNLELYAAITTDTAEGYQAYLYDDGGEDCELACFDLPAAALVLGRAWTLVTIPGELTPELLLGGVVSPPGYAGPYPDAPVEEHLAAHLVTAERFVIGLAYAEVGYLYPKRTYWPEEFSSQQHGPGPDVAGVFLAGLGELLDELSGLR